MIISGVLYTAPLTPRKLTLIHPNIAPRGDMSPPVCSTANKGVHYTDIHIAYEGTNARIMVGWATTQNVYASSPRAAIWCTLPWYSASFMYSYVAYMELSGRWRGLFSQASRESNFKKNSLIHSLPPFTAWWWWYVYCTVQYSTIVAVLSSHLNYHHETRAINAAAACQPRKTVRFYFLSISFYPAYNCLAQTDILREEKGKKAKKELVSAFLEKAVFAIFDLTTVK